MKKTTNKRVIILSDLDSGYFEQAVFYIKATARSSEDVLVNEANNTLSNSALETLAIIAYNEPITRIQVDEIRGVQTGQLIRKLVAKGLIKEAGRSELPGRPILYKTTSEFLDYFGLSTIDDLPKIRIKEVINDEVDLYNSKYQEEIIE